MDFLFADLLLNLDRSGRVESLLIVVSGFSFYSFLEGEEILVGEVDIRLGFLVNSA